MKKYKGEDIYRHIAEEYTKSTGETLQQERDNLPPGSAASPRLDALVPRRIRTLKNQKILRISGLAAACLLILLVFPLVRFIQGSNTDKISESQAESQAPSEAELIPLSFSLPANFQVSHTELDQGASIYHLTDSKEDNVVMQMEYADTAEPVFASLKPLQIDGNQAYGLSTADYKILTFVHGDILYTLTCRYDVSTLIDISKNIF